TVHSGAGTQKDFSGKGEGTYYYRVMSSNEFNISSGWSGVKSVEVSAPAAVYTISGIVTGADGVTVALSGDATWNQGLNSGGSYSFTVNHGGNYTVTPSKVGYTFTPVSQIFTNVKANKTQDFLATGNTPEITFVSIPGGTFEMGDVENSGNSDEKPVHTVTVSGFEMSVYEITNAQYAVYLNAAIISGDVKVTSGDVYGKTGAWSGQRYMDIGYSYNSSNKCWITYSGGAFSVTSGYENWPVVMVTWYGSKAFSLYYGLDLPTESEWEYACRGGNQYQYGTNDGTINSTKANFDSNIGHPVDVGSYPANPYGLYDMSGNVWEWCHDWYGTYPSGSVTNPTGAQTGSYTGSYRVKRGGGWYNYVGPCRSAYRFYSPYNDYLGRISFRVVRRPGGLTY
ncbi:SUMF1/EgtB/PvdO family nonheme iron enzyme, partial [Candidatus Latescibacterota bacterium]